MDKKFNSICRPSFFIWHKKSIWLQYCIICFCLISRLYLINDCIDIKADQKHPIKYKRPIASGLISKKFAIYTSIFLIFLSTFVSGLINHYLTLILISYLLIQLAYCLKLKRSPLIDLFCISSGFLLRSISGLLASELELSPWFILSVGLLSLFLAVEKERLNY